MPDVFISHVEEDADIALELARGLEEAGYTTWYFERDSVPGVSYLAQTGGAVDDCRAFVLVISPHSLGSNQVTAEVVRAHEGNRPFFPVLQGISHVEFQGRQPVWRQAVGSAASIALPAHGLGAAVARIVEGLRAMGIQPGSGEAAPKVVDRATTGHKPVTAGARRTPLRRRPLVWAAAAAVALLALVGVAVVVVVLALNRSATPEDTARASATAPQPTRAQVAVGAATATPKPTTAPAKPTTVAQTAAPTQTAQPTATATPRPTPLPLPVSASAISPDNAAKLAELTLVACEQPRHVAWSRDGTRLAVAAPGLPVYDTATWQQVFNAAVENAGRVAFSPDGATLAAICGDEVRLWDMATGGEVNNFPCLWASNLAFAPGGETLMAVGQPGIKVWDAATHVELRTVGFGAYSKNPTFSPTWDLIAAGSITDLRLWDLATGEELRQLPSPSGGWYQGFAFSPDGAVLASSANDRRIFLWDVVTGQARRTLTAPDTPAGPVAFSADGRLLVAATGPKLVIWEAATGRYMGTFSGHTNDINTLAFSPDGAFLATSAEDGIRLWGAK